MREILAGDHHKKIKIALLGYPGAMVSYFFDFFIWHHSRHESLKKKKSGAHLDTTLTRYQDYLLDITLLPEISALNNSEPDEVVVREFLFEQKPDLILNIVDARHLKNHLQLTLQLIETGIPVVVALSNYANFFKEGDFFDFQSLAGMIGVPFVAAEPRRGSGIRKLLQRIISVKERTDSIVRKIDVPYGDMIERAIGLFGEKLQEQCDIPLNIPLRYMVIRLLVDDPLCKKRLHSCQESTKLLSEIEQEVRRIEKYYQEKITVVISDARSGFIYGALKETIKPGISEKRRISDVIDTFFTHRFWGFMVFFVFLWIMFEATFRLGSYPKQWIGTGVNALSDILSQTMRDGMFKELLIDGIISGIGGVVVFLPNILILFFFISLMEETGYMSRAVFIMDKAMHRIGLHGKSFIPLIMGFGCNVPAIMATRIIENREDRLVTMLINPFISCSARLPVYILLIGAFFPSHSGSVLFMIYLIGILIAVLTAILLKKTIFKTRHVPFVMELPPYRIPTLRSTLSHMWREGLQYLKKIAGVILIAAILIWALGYFPRHVNYSTDYEARASSITEQYDVLITEQKIKGESNIALLKEQRDKDLSLLMQQKNAEKQEKSYIGRIGHFIEPVIYPLGFDWKMGISILSGVAAKEIVVSTMAVLYQSDPHIKGTDSDLSQKLKAQVYVDGKRKGASVYTPAVALSFMLFILLYFPCAGTIVTITRESGSWKWAAFSIIYSTLVAWVVSFLVYQAGILI